MNTATQPRPVHLEINNSGAWKRVLSFDVADEAEVLHAAAALLRWGGDKLTARVIMPGDTAPLMTWNAQFGWREWGERMRAARDRTTTAARVTPPSGRAE